MPTRFYYILIGLVSASLYLIYSIGYYTLQQFQTSSFMESIESANKKTEQKNREKEFLARYIRTPAYQSQVAKATHNKKLSTEETINIIRQDDVEGNKNQDTSVVIAEAQKKENDPTKNMTNPEKWWYLIEMGI